MGRGLLLRRPFLLPSATLALFASKQQVQHMAHRCWFALVFLRVLIRTGGSDQQPTAPEFSGPQIGATGKIPHGRPLDKPVVWAGLS